MIRATISPLSYSDPQIRRNIQVSYIYKARSNENDDIELSLPDALRSTLDGTPHGEAASSSGDVGELSDELILRLQSGLATKCRLLDCRGCHFLSN